MSFTKRRIRMNLKTNINIQLLVLMLVLLSAGQAAVGATIYVPADFNSIQAAIDGSNYGDEIEVAPGTYNEAINFNGKAVRLSSISGPDVTTIDANGVAGAYHVVQCVSGEGSGTVLEGFTITGGNANGIAYPDDCGGGMYNYESNPSVTNCIFTGNAAVYCGGGMYNERSSPKMTQCTFMDNTANEGGGMGNEYARGPYGPSVTDCNFINNTADWGGGMYNYGSDPIVTNCTFSNNTAMSYGGGIYNYLISWPTVTKCKFIGNEARDGGGMLNDNSRPTVTECIFSDNTANSSGGGMLNQSYSHPTVTNCTFNSNEASNGGGILNQSDSRPVVTNSIFNGNEASNGGGMFNQSSSPTVTHCIFNNNTANNAGGGMYNYNGQTNVRNCTFTNNTTSIGGGMFNRNNYATLTNCILWGDIPDEIFDTEPSSELDYCDIQGGWSGDGGNNIDADPRFVNVSSGNLRLSTPASPCVDAGDSTILLNERIYLDLDGKHRYVDIDSVDDTGYGPLEFLDMGAYEFNCNYTAGDSNCDGVVDFKDLGILCGNWLTGAGPK
jgi:parallel beta-helix repeat protein